MSLHNRSQDQPPLAAPRNNILAALPQPDYQRLLPHLQPLALKLGEVLVEAGVRVEYVYFPNSAMLSCVLTAQDGKRVEVGLIGSDGVACADIALDQSPAWMALIVQHPGLILRLPAAVFCEQFKAGGPLQDLVLRHLQHMTFQTATCALCNRLHALEQRLCRWLLMTRDLIDRDEVALTQEFLSHMLGVQRSGVTLAVGTLERAGLIRTHRGCITIVDRAGLEATSCECYRRIHDHSQRMLG